MIHRHLPVKLVQRLPLGVGDRYHEDFRELLIEPYEIEDFEMPCSEVIISRHSSVR
jgi:hypothetical protein